MTDTFHADPVATARGELQAREARVAVLALRSAVVVSLIRAIVLPLLIQWAPPNTFPGADPAAIQMWGFTQAVLCGVLSVWARKDPLSACLSAMVFYLAMAVPDILEHEGFLQQGWISKLVMISIFVRGLIAGVMHRSMKPAAVSVA